MATWWNLDFTGEPTEADYEHVSAMVAQGHTSGQLVNYETCRYCHNDITEGAMGEWAMVPAIRGGENCVFAADGKHVPAEEG